ncbi:MAG: hypothetical protein E6Q53_01120 [Candidatus Moraniibacteriota bacterium]|nr:MAG: hypothetical protein E6Q53_01120 [Candidatus Moranbacteria bacterium]
MKVQGRTYPGSKDLTKLVPTGRTGLDMKDLIYSLHCLGVRCEEHPNTTAHAIFNFLLDNPLQVVVFCHQMLAGTYGQYRRCESGHYACAVFADKKRGDIYTADSGFRYPRWGVMNLKVFDGVFFDNLIDDPKKIVSGWALSIPITAHNIHIE